MIITALCIAILVDVLASIGIWRDGGVKIEQRVFQLALVWLIPFLGAAVTIAVRRSQRSEKPVAVHEPWTSISENQAVTHAVAADHSSSSCNHSG